jgi:hypothetical protein
METDQTEQIQSGLVEDFLDDHHSEIFRAYKDIATRVLSEAEEDHAKEFVRRIQLAILKEKENYRRRTLRQVYLLQPGAEINDDDRQLDREHWENCCEILNALSDFISKVDHRARANRK